MQLAISVKDNPIIFTFPQLRRAVCPSIYSPKTRVLSPKSASNISWHCSVLLEIPGHMGPRFLGVTHAPPPIGRGSAWKSQSFVVRDKWHYSLFTLQGGTVEELITFSFRNTLGVSLVNPLIVKGEFLDEINHDQLQIFTFHINL